MEGKPNLPPPHMLTFLRKFKSVSDIYYPCEATVRLLGSYDKADYEPLTHKDCVMNNTIVTSTSISIITQQIKQILEEELSKNPGSNGAIKIDLTGFHPKQE